MLYDIAEFHLNLHILGLDSQYIWKVICSLCRYEGVIMDLILFLDYSFYKKLLSHYHRSVQHHIYKVTRMDGSFDKKPQIVEFVQLQPK